MKNLTKRKTTTIWFLSILGLFGGFTLSADDSQTIEELKKLVELQGQQIQSLTKEVEALKQPGKLKYERTATGKIVVPSAEATKPAKPSLFSSYPIKFYGYIKADAAYDSGRTQGNLAHYALPGYESFGDEFSLTANQTRFGFDIGGDEASPYSPTAKIEVDFYGSNSAQNKGKVRMRKAYVKWNSADWTFLAGQNTDVIVQAIPTTVDFNYYHLRGKVGYRNPQITATRNIDLGDGKFTPTVGLSRIHGQDADGDGQDDGSDAAFPAVQWALPITGDFFGTGNAKLALAGHWGYEKADFAFKEDNTLDTWSIGASWIIPISDMLSVKGTVWKGANLDHFLAGIGQGVNAATGDVIDAQGGWIQFGVKLSPKLSWNFGAGFDDTEDEDLSSGMRTKNSQIGTNIYYNVTTGLQLGLEFEHIKTEYVDLPDGESDRVQGTVIYKF